MKAMLTLDPGMAARLERLAKARGATREAVLNEALRRGLEAMDAPAEAPTPFRTRAHDCGEWLAPGKTPRELLREMDEEYDRKKLGLD